MSPPSPLSPLNEPGGMVVSRPPPLTGVRPGASLGLTLMSDLHLGSPDCDTPLVRRELSLARARGDRVLLNGDVMDLILPRDPKRYRPSGLHPRLSGCDDVVNKTVDLAAEVLGPYADLIDVAANGNHEKAVVDHAGVDAMLLLLERLGSLRKAGAVLYGGYCGMVIYNFQSAPGRPVPGKRLVLFYHHGWGKGSALSSAAGDWKSCTFLEGVDVVWLGHLHARMSAHVSRIRPPAGPRGDRPVLHDVRFVRTGAYLRTYGPQSRASVARHGFRAPYGAVRGLAPHGCGGARVVLSFDKRLDYALHVEQ